MAGLVGVLALPGLEDRFWGAEQSKGIWTKPKAQSATSARPRDNLTGRSVGFQVGAGQGITGYALPAMSEPRQFPPPRDWQVFEDFCRDLFAAEWGDPDTQKHGRPGQAQHGVDVFGLRHGRYQAVQCKLRGSFPERRLTERQIRDEVTAAGEFTQPLETLVIATTAPPDTGLQALAMALTQDHGEAGPRVVVYGWSELCEKLEHHEKVCRRWLEKLYEPTPSYSDEATRELSEALERAHLKHEELTTAGEDASSALDVFFSYCRCDEKLRDVLEKHLTLLKRDGSIRAWHDRRIGAGREWQGEIDRRLDSADLILLLISPDFLASDYCFDREMGRALERHEAGEARVVPVILRPTDWQSGDLARLQALPAGGRAITKWGNRDEAFVDVVRGLRRVVAELQSARRDGATGEAEPPEPAYADDATRELAVSLETAYRQKAELSASGRDTAEVVEEILRLRRRLRQGAQLKAGDSLLDGRFQLLEVIGQGGFAQVWKAYDRQGRSQVAVKVLHGQHTGDASRRERFFRGARLMARLAHPNVVRVVEQSCEDGEYPFFVMEYLGGGDFRHAVLAGRLSRQERLQIVLEVGAALAFAHARDVIHRDVKPHNVLLAPDGSPKLTDFDLVRAADTTGGTRTAMLGTFLYASPEAMVDARQAAEPADVYGLGMTALFALHGGDLPADVLWDVPELVAGLEVSEGCRRVLLRAVARKVGDRWSTVDGFCDALRQALATRSAAEYPINGEQEIVHEKDGSVLVHVPGGEFRLGTDEDLPGIAEEYQGWWKPEHRVILRPYWIGKYPVANAQYGRFLKETPDQGKPAFWEDKRFNQPDQPVVGVSWSEVMAYCKWAGLVLPSEAQWEAAARGPDGRPYPWGDASPAAEYADFNKDFGTGKPDPVGSHPKGAGPYGTMDQAGGVWEWCADAWDEHAYRDRDGRRDPVAEGDAGKAGVRVVRGGSWASRSWFLLAAVRHGNRAGYRVLYLGFRVCRFGPEH